MRAVTSNSPAWISLLFAFAFLGALAFGGVAFADEGMAGADLQAGIIAQDGGENDAGAASDDVREIPMHRLYNGFTGEHFYTGDEGERDYLVNAGWLYEGVGWTAPETSKTPVYRLYNPFAGDHHYTTSAEERDMLIKAKWNDEGIGWYSDDEQTLAVYRQYNPNAWTGTHNFTCSEDEAKSLAGVGWRDEGISWYAIGEGWGYTMTSFNTTHLLALLSCMGGGGSITQGYNTAIDPDKLQRLNQLANAGTEVSFIAINAVTGKGVSFNPDRRYYGASTIKAPYVAGLCRFNAPGIGAWQSTLYSVITWSSNEGFNSLVARYGTFYERAFANAAAVDLQLPYGGGYADLTPRELCKLWMSIRDYICSTEVNADMFRGLFGNGGYFKEGWMYNGMLGGQTYHLAGVNGPVVYAVMTRYQYRDHRVWEIQDALVDALK